MEVVTKQREKERKNKNFEYNIMEKGVENNTSNNTVLTSR